MKPHVHGLESNQVSSLRVERRGKPRIRRFFSVRVAGVDTNGERFRFEAALDNISSSGLYLYSPRPLEAGARLFLVVRFAPDQIADMRAPRFAMLGVVRRAESKPDGSHGVAIAFTSQRQL